MIVRIEADALDLTLPSGASGLIDQIRAGDQPNTVVLILDGGAGPARTATATADGVTRVTIEVPGAAAPPADTGVAAPPPPPVAVATDGASRTRRHFALVAIDPGHGGDDVGVRTADGLRKKS